LFLESEVPPWGKVRRVGLLRSSSSAKSRTFLLPQSLGFAAARPPNPPNRQRLATSSERYNATERFGGLGCYAVCEAKTLRQRDHGLGVRHWRLNSESIEDIQGWVRVASGRCRAKLARIRRPRPDCGLGFQVKVLKSVLSCFLWTRHRPSTFGEREEKADNRLRALA
jgi:hypothetical protein